MNSLLANNFRIKTKKYKNIEIYLNSSKWLVLSFEQYLPINNNLETNYIHLKKNNYQEMIDKYKINKRVAVVGKYEEIVGLCRYLKTRKIKTYMITF